MGAVTPSAYVTFTVAGSAGTVPPWVRTSTPWIEVAPAPTPRHSETPTAEYAVPAVLASALNVARNRVVVTASKDTSFVRPRTAGSKPEAPVTSRQEAPSQYCTC